MASHRDNWDLTTIPDELLKKEWVRRMGAKGGSKRAKPSDDPAVEEARRIQREYRRKRREEGKDK